MVPFLTGLLGRSAVARGAKRVPSFTVSAGEATSSRARPPRNLHPPAVQPAVLGDSVVRCIDTVRWTELLSWRGRAGPGGAGETGAGSLRRSGCCSGRVVVAPGVSQASVHAGPGVRRELAPRSGRADRRLPDDGSHARASLCARARLVCGAGQPARASGSCPERLPTVLSRSEVAAVLAALKGVEHTCGCLLYGACLRLMELLRLRVKDVDFSNQQIIIRDGKGGRDRVALLIP